MVGRAKRPLANKRAGSAIIGSTGLISLVLFAFLRAFEAQVERLRATGTAGTGYGELHGRMPAKAVDDWWNGHSRLDAFDPVSPPVLIRIHAGAEIIDDPSRIDKLLDMGVDGIMTDMPKAIDRHLSRRSPGLPRR